MRLLWLTAPLPISNTSQWTWRERGQNCTPINMRLELVPRQYSTGSKSILGRISKRGSQYIRLFIQAANIILMRPHYWEKFSFGAL
jgi:hypothetical protein